MASASKDKVAFITGITGQDGSYLAEFLLSKGYMVHGLIRRSSSFNTQRIEHLYTDKYQHQGGIYLHYGDMTDICSMITVLNQVRPTEIYNLAAQSHVKISFDLAEYTAEVSALGSLRILEAIRSCNLVGNVKFYQASTSEMFGKVTCTPQSETTSFYPRSPYGAAKLYAHSIVINYREAYGLFACNGILFNHESPRRGENFVTRKITRGVAKIALGLQDKITLGNLDAVRDWGHARDYVEAMWLMLQSKEPDDYVIATGEGHTVRDFVEEAFSHIQLTISWRGSGMEEVGVDQNGVLRVLLDAKYTRPSEVDLLIGDSSKARRKLNWSPKTKFSDLVKEMVQADMELAMKFPES